MCVCICALLCQKPLHAIPLPRSVSQGAYHLRIASPGSDLNPWNQTSLYARRMWMRGRAWRARSSLAISLHWPRLVLIASHRACLTDLCYFTPRASMLKICTAVKICSAHNSTWKTKPELNSLDMPAGVNAAIKEPQKQQQWFFSLLSSSLPAAGLSAQLVMKTSSSAVNPLHDCIDKTIAWHVKRMISLSGKVKVHVLWALGQSRPARAAVQWA